MYAMHAGICVMSVYSIRCYNISNIVQLIYPIWQCCVRIERGHLFSKCTSVYSELFFDKASLSRKCSYFRCHDACLSDRLCCTNIRCMSWEQQTAFTLARGIHTRIPGDLSLFVYKLLPEMTVPGVWEETITGSLHSQIILQPGALHGYDSEWILVLLPHLRRHFRKTEDRASDK